MIAVRTIWDIMQFHRIYANGNGPCTARVARWDAVRPMSRGIVLAVALLVTGAAFAASARGSTHAIACGTITLRLRGNDFSYRVRVERGRIACTTARTVLRSFMATKVVPRGWACFRGHSANPWAASCAGVSTTRRGIVIRSYLIAG